MCNGNLDNFEAGRVMTFFYGSKNLCLLRIPLLIKRAKVFHYIFLTDVDYPREAVYVYIDSAFSALSFIIN